MRRHKKWGPAVLAAAVIACGTCSAYAMHLYAVKVENKLQMGKVQIRLEEFLKNEKGEETSYQDSRLVVPGQTVSKIPRITNQEEPVYLRVKVSFGGSYEGEPEIRKEPRSDQEELFLADDSCLNGISPDWIKIGEHYYYKHVLGTKEHVDVFESVTFPEQFTEDTAGQKTCIHIQAEAIQAENFTPDFTSRHPWGNERILECVHESDGKVISVKKQYQGLSVSYEGDAKGLIAAPEDFFVNLGTLMPGDTVTDSVVLRNTSRYPVTMKFAAGLSEDLTNVQSDLLEKIRLKISYRDHTVYEGDLRAKSLEEGISLGDIAPKSKEAFRFQISVPEDVNNIYAFAQSKTDWKFTASYEQKPQTADAPKTNDPFQVRVVLCAGAAVAGGVCLYSLRKRRIAGEAKKQ